MSKVRDNSKTVINDSGTLKTNYPLFSFKYMSSNNNYNFKFFGNKEKSKKLSAYDELMAKLKTISEMSMKDFGILPKATGFELLELSDFNHNVKSILKNTGIVSKDSKLMVSRFCNEKYRMICKQDNKHQNIFYIICFEFDYSAYKHG